MGRKIAILAVLFIGLALRLAPLARTDLPVGADGFYHYRTTASIIEEGNVPEWDHNSYGGRPHIYAPGFHLLSSAFQLLTQLPLRQIAILTGPIFYIFSAVLASLYSPLSAFFLSTIPVYLWRTTITFLVSALWTFLIYTLIKMRKRKIAILFALALALTHSAALVVLPLLAILHRNRKRSAVFWFSTVVASIWWLDIQSIHQGVPASLQAQIFEGISLTAFVQRSGIQGLLAILGIPSGGTLAVTWTAVFIAFVSAGLMELDRAIEASGLVIAVLASKVTDKRLIPALVIISTVWAYSTLGALDWGYISSDERAAMDWIRENSLPDSTVASTLGEGYWVNGYLNRKNVMDGHFATMEDVEERMEALQHIFSSSPGDYLDTYDISFLFGSTKAKYGYGFDGSGYDSPLFTSETTDVYFVRR